MKLFKVVHYTGSVLVPLRHELFVVAWDIDAAIKRIRPELRGDNMEITEVCGSEFPAFAVAGTAGAKLVLPSPTNSGFRLGEFLDEENTQLICGLMIRCTKCDKEYVRGPREHECPSAT